MSTVPEPAQIRCQGCGEDLRKKSRRKNRENGHYLCPPCYLRMRANRKKRSARKELVRRAVWIVILIAIALVAMFIAVRLRNATGLTTL